MIRAGGGFCETPFPFVLRKGVRVDLIFAPRVRPGGQRANTAACVPFESMQ